MQPDDVRAALGDLTDGEVAHLAGRLCVMRNAYVENAASRTARFYAAMFNDAAAGVAGERDRRAADRSFDVLRCAVVDVEGPGRAA